MRLVSQRQFARDNGLSLSGVQAAIRSGRITKVPGTTSLDAEGALLDWKKNTRPYTRDRAPNPPPDARVEPDLIDELADELADDNDSSGTGELEDGSEGTYNASRAKREHFNAELARLRFLAEEKSLVDRGEVEKAAFEVARQIRDAMIGIPDRLAATLAAETDERKVYGLLYAEITRALATTSDELTTHT